MIHVLLIEDNPGDARLISELYNDSDDSGSEYRITHVQRIRDAIQILSADHDISLILSDITLPDSEGLGTLASLSTAASDLPIIFMTGTNNDDLVSAAMNAGAQDYLVKGHIEPELLARTTRYAIERKRVQNEMAKALEQNAVIKQRANLLTQQKRQLVALNKAKDEFISLSSHQLRTPATGVKQYLGMILEGYAGDVPDNLRVFLRTAYDSNERQLTVINDLLKTAQLDSGRYSLSKQRTDVSKMLADIVEEYHPIIVMRSQHIIMNVPDEAYCNVDAGELRLALANLLENASKYSSEGTNITLSVSEETDGIEIQISDEGVGMHKRDLKKIFDKFTRVDNRLSDTVNGSGLGLYFVKRIVRMHGGTLDVQSVLDKGSTFTIGLPYD